MIRPSNPFTALKLSCVAAGASALALTCSPISEQTSPSSTRQEPPALVSGSYAAMDEVPAQGGELRLEKPIEIEIELEVEVDGDGVEPGVDGESPSDVAKQKVTAIAFPLKHTAVEVDVSGLIGLYTVTQHFENPYDDPLEAVYVFPLGDKAAVVNYEIVIGDRVVKGVVHTRDKARKIYAEAKQQGHTTALLEEDKPNVFTQHIANIAPREAIVVRFKYIEMLEYRDNTYELVYPMVVGPRYLPADRPGRRPVASHVAGSAPVAGARSIPYVDAQRLGSSISFHAAINAGVPIVSAQSPSHDIEITSQGDTRRDVTLRMHDAIPHRSEEQDGFFTLVIQPKADYREGDVRAREVVVLIDRSGSMAGAPLSQARSLATALVQTLGDRDVFNVITFASGTDKMSSGPIAGDVAGRAKGVAWISQVASGGGTEMERGILTSLATKPNNDRMRMVYVLSDGFVGNDSVILNAAKKYLGHNRIYPIGVGSSPN